MVETQTAILAGGCFWGMQDLIRKLPGVIATRVGYTGGQTKNPTYRDIVTGKTNHAESILIEFDPTEITYRSLLEFFFQIHDPTTMNRQGNDVGTQYRSAIFYLDESQKETAKTLISELEQSEIWRDGVITQLTPAGEFYDAEEQHQDYLEKYPEGYTCHFIRPDWKLREPV